MSYNLFEDEEISEIRVKELLKSSVGFNNSNNPWSKNNLKITNTYPAWFHNGYY